MANGTKYIAIFCGLNNILYGPEELFNKYSMRESFFLFFDYVGPSSLYVTVYNTDCLDIFNGVPNKMTLKDIGKQICFKEIDMSDSSSKSSGNNDFL